MRQTNKDGQTIGRKGAESRARLMDATTRLIGEMPVKKLTASAIARRAGLASQTFYLYFRNVEEALLHLAVTAQTDMQDIRSTLDQPWDLDAIALHADRFVDAFYRYWDRHRALLTVRNFLADSGNDAFVRQRSESAMPIVTGISQRILAAHGAGAVSEREASARAILLYAAIERMAARYAMIDEQESAIASADLTQAAASLLELLLSPSA
jgi:AcrR family transcriptional regulator